MRTTSVVVVLGSVFFACAASGVTAVPAGARSTSGDDLWREVGAAAVTMSLADVASLNEPAVFAAKTKTDDRVYVLNVARLDSITAQAPKRQLLASREESGPEITLPLPDGTFARFRLYENGVIPPELAAQMPGTRTYSGVGIDVDARASVERTQSGWSAMILASDGTSFVTPLFENRADVYVSVPKDTTAEEIPFRCEVEGSSDQGESSGSERKLPNSFGGSTRTYRMAMAATAEYTNYFRQTADTDAQAKRRAADEIARVVSRINEVFGADLGVQFTLVADQLKIIYTDPGTDPYTNTDKDKLLNENQITLDKEIKSSGYDIGHVVGTGGGGFATLRSACISTSKARGETGSSKPVTDSFYIDYVAHEVGHQFGANHTFNTSVGKCGNNRRAAAAYEPGSGSTIMSYAGLCPGQNVQKNSDSYFHAISLDEMIAHITGGGACVTAVANGDRPPAVSFGGASSVMIPKSTPFELSVTASDPDGDSLQFSWEQYDLGDGSSVGGDNDSDGKLRPMFRSIRHELASRAFPSVMNLANVVPAVTSFESLPTKSKLVTIRTIARDQRGGFAFADSTAAVIDTSGPFTITMPAASTSWKSGQTQTITWQVAKTTDPPLSCPTVRISISTDGGRTFKQLVASTANDGSATVTVPTVTSTSKAVVKINGIGQVFFAATPLFSVVP